ncbi:DUF2292 domain-containing protein [Sporanaerobacter acetigenes]|uniref:Uncharacterized small protein n=1 Tax=Sporanaerobacter acetigenes DSM 13106 TaxID=1123281 RepID=A0A1M5VI48_9FIRM|nr:DUF2292 domain-containing protein [Sporanaerobacter acetigenes]SHH74907.1 Uncharacterized small protein [Sporanaerobacter acetigenes DSM 13106]
MIDEKNSTMELTNRERKLIEIIRKTEFGEINIIVQDSEPIRIQELKKSIKL